MQCTEVGGGDRANGAVTSDEGVPHRQLALKESICPQIDREVIRQVAPPTIVEVEEDSLSRTGSIFCYARVTAVTIAVAKRPAQVIAAATEAERRDARSLRYSCVFVAKRLIPITAAN